MIREIATNETSISIYDTDSKVISIMQDRAQTDGSTDRNVVIVDIDNVDKVIRALLHIRDSVLYSEA